MAANEDKDKKNDGATDKKRKSVPNLEKKDSNMKNQNKRKMSISNQQFRTEPSEITFMLIPDTPLHLVDAVLVYNYNAVPIFYVTRSTNLSQLRPEPNAGLIEPFGNQTVEIFYMQRKALTYAKSEKSPDRLTFEWIKLASDNSNAEDAAKLMKETVRTSRYQHQVNILYKVEQKYEISEALTEKCRHAFDNVTDSLTLIGDFENQDVSGTLRIVNESKIRIIWSLEEVSNVLLTCAPKEGLLGSGSHVDLTIATKRFHVGNVGAITDVVFVEWTAAADCLTEFSRIAIEDSPNIFKIGIKVFYKYEAKKPN